MAKRKTLEWGETPFDGMSADDLRRTCQAFYSALSSTRSCLAMSRHNNPSSIYWDAEQGGSGGVALSKADYLLDRISKKYDDAYGAFFRYADDLLFPKLPKRGSGWYVCDCGCKTMVATLSTLEKPSNYIGSCKTPDKMRPIKWSDLKPNSPPSDKTPTPQ